MATDRISSEDSSYLTGDLSLFPSALDSYDQLYEARNLSRTKLTKDVPFISDYIFVEDASLFPEKGILRIYLPNKPGFVSEFIYYENKDKTSFYNLKRNFMPALDVRRHEPWPAGSIVESGVFAEHHNALKDALINIQTKLGNESASTDATITGSIKNLQNKFLAPIPVFRAFPLKGNNPTTITFKNFSTSTATRFFWDFGDGGSSYEKNPIYTYRREGVFTVELRIISESGGQGIAQKKNYITISNSNIEPFAYVTPLVGYSIQTKGNDATKFNYIDQTQGRIVNRLFQFGDESTFFAEDPNVHTVTHQYKYPGKYKPSVLITYEGAVVNKVYFQENAELEIR